MSEILAESPGDSRETPRPWAMDCTVNGRRVQLPVNPEQSLLEFLRMELGLMGTKGACLEGECGSCTVFVDGKPMNSCLVMAGQVQGREILTIEGLAHGDKLHVLQQKFIECGAVQCGYCTPGLIMAALDILENQPGCSESDFLTSMEGNICRCTGYNKIFEAVHAAWKEWKAAEA